MAATVHRWRATQGNGDWAGATSWDTLGTPGDGGAGLDTALFDGKSQAFCTTNLDRVTGIPDNNLYRVITTTNYTGDIGGPGNYLYHELASSGDPLSRLIHRGTGRVFFKGESADNVVYVDSAHNPADYAATLDGTMLKVIVKQGRVYIGPTCNVQEVHLIGPFATVEIASGANPPTVVNVAAGNLVNYRNFTSAAPMTIGRGGAVTQYGLLYDAQPVFNNGALIPRPTSEPGGSNNPKLYCDGVLDLTDNDYAYSWTDIVLGPDAVIQGGALDAGGLSYSTTGIFLDSREEYP